MGQMYFDVWANGDEQGTALGELSHATDKSISKLYNAIGSGQFTLNRHDEQMAWVTQDNLVRVRLEAGGPFDYDDERYVFAFVIEEGEDGVLSPQEDGGEEITRSGRQCHAAYLQRAIIWPTSNHPDNAIYWTRALKDGVVRLLAENFAEGGRSVGSVLRTFIRDAQARTPNPLAPLDDDFSYGLDSNGDSWTETDTDWEFPVGMHLLELLEKLVAAGLYHECTAEPVLRAWDTPQGTDLSGSITFAEGDNIRTSADRTVHAKVAVSREVVKGVTTTDTLKYREVVDAALETELGGRREGYVEYGATPTDARLDLAGQKAIDQARNQHEGPTELGVYDTEGRTAFVDYQPGDTVLVDIPGVFDEEAAQITGITLADEENGEYQPTLNFREQAWDGLGTDSLGQADTTPGGGEPPKGCRDCPPLEPYVPDGEEPVETPVPCDDGTPGLAAQSFYPLGAGTGGNAAATPSPGIVHYFRPGVGEPTCPTTSGMNSWHFPTYGAGGAGTEDSAGRNVGNELQLRFQGPGTVTVDANVTGEVEATWQIIHTAVGGVSTVDDSGTGIPGSWAIPDDGFCCHRLEIHVGGKAGGGSASSGGFFFRGGTWTPDVTVTTPPFTPPVPGQEGREQITGTTASTTYTTNFPYVPGSLHVTVDGASVVPDETDPAAGEFELVGDYTGSVVVVRYTIASSTGTGATNPPPDPDAPTGGGGGGAITVKDEGTPLATDASSLDFVGAGVVASGATGDKTITISGAPAGAAGGDLSGTYPNPSVVNDSHDHTAATLTGVIETGDAAGGDLSGTYPNPSVVDDSHSHGAGTAPGAYSNPLTTRGDLLYRDASTTTRKPLGTAGYRLASDGTDANWTADYASIIVIIDGQGAVPSTGVKADVSLPFACTVVRARLLADAAGSAVVDIWNDTYANYPPTVADSITASAKPTLSSANKSSDTTLTGWTTALAEGSTLRFNLDSITTITRLMVELRVRKT